MLATIEKIENIRIHPNADKLMIANVRGWQTIIQKDTFKEGEKIIFVQPDTIVNRASWNEFLFDDKLKIEKRIKPIKLRGEISVGLVVPISVLPPEISTDIETEVSEIIGVKKYVKEIPANLQGINKGNFPSVLPKTDEERIENCKRVLEELEGIECAITIKCDGTSASYVVYEGEHHVCSRNLSKKETEESVYWQMYHKYDIKKFLDENPNLALQGEIIGGSIQKNPMQVEGFKLLIFNVYNIEIGRYLGYDEMNDVLSKYPLIERVPFLTRMVFNGMTQEKLKEMAKGYYEGTKNNREGIVIRSVKEMYSYTLKGRMSFKCINDDYKD